MRQFYSKTYNYVRMFISYRKKSRYVVNTDIQRILSQDKAHTCLCENSHGLVFDAGVHTQAPDTCILTYIYLHTALVHTYTLTHARSRARAYTHTRARGICARVKVTSNIHAFTLCQINYCKHTSCN